MTHVGRGDGAEVGEHEELDVKGPPVQVHVREQQRSRRAREELSSFVSHVMRACLGRDGESAREAHLEAALGVAHVAHADGAHEEVKAAHEEVAHEGSL